MTCALNWQYTKHDVKLKPKPKSKLVLQCYSWKRKTTRIITIELLSSDCNSLFDIKRLVFFWAYKSSFELLHYLAVSFCFVLLLRFSLLHHTPFHLICTEGVGTNTHVFYYIYLKHSQVHFFQFTRMSDEKVTILLRAVGDAPILKQKKFNVDVNRTVAWFSQVIRKMINLPDDQSLHIYISQTFAPSPDHSFGSLRDCYAVKTDGKDDHLIMHYSTTSAWG